MKTTRMLALLMMLVMAMSCLGLSVCAEGLEAFTVGEDKTIYVSASEDMVDEYLYFSFTPEQSGSYAFCVDGLDFDAVEQYVSLSVELDGEDVITYAYEDFVGFDAQMGVTYTLCVNYFGIYSEDTQYTLFVEPWEAPEPLALVVGENQVTVPYEGLSVSFTPEQTGCYLIYVAEEDPASCWMEAETATDKTDEYYVMDAGETYSGEIYSFEDEAVEVTVYIEYVADAAVVEPVAMEITSLPDNTTYLSAYLDELWAYFTLDGLRMDITWSDGSVSDWSYEEEFVFVGGHELVYNIVEADPTVQVVLSIPDLDVEPVSFELTMVDLIPEAIELVDDSDLQIVEYSCGLDIGALGMGVEGWIYLPLSAYTREVLITFDDGSTVTALPGDYVYGLPVGVIDNQGGSILSAREQPEGFWSKDSDNYVVFTYGELEVELAVEIVDSPVSSVEMLTPPKNDTVMVNDDFEMINAEGEIIDSIRELYDGMSLKVGYTDGTVKTFAAEEIEWIDIAGEEFPFVDGYPVGVIDGLLCLLGEDAEMVPPCELEIVVEYKGVETAYTLSVVEEFEQEPPAVEPPADDSEKEEPPVDDPEEKPEIEINPETDDMDAVVLVAVVAIASMLSVVVVVQKKKTF